MEHFSISCTTCRSRLQVRDESIIGQILACPKCGSMVEVQAPEDWSSETNDSEQKPVQKSIAPPASTSSFDDDDEQYVDAAPGEVPATPQPETVADEKPQPKQASDVPMPPTGDWSSDSTRRNKKMAMIGLASIGGLVVVIGLATFLMGGPSEAPSGPIADSTPDDTKPKTNNDPADEPNDDNKLEPKDDPLVDKPIVEPKTDPKDDPVPKPVVPVDPPMPPADADKGKPTKPDDDEGPPGLEPLKPIGEPADPSDDPDGLLKDLNKFGEFLDDEPFETTPVDPKDDPTVDEPPALPRPAPRKVDIALRLKDPIPAIEFPSVSLVELLDFISDFSGMPITVDPEALEHRRVSGQQTITIKKLDTTVGDVLTTALGPLQLLHKPQGNHLVITRSAIEGDDLREIKYPINDLAGNDAEATMLRKMLTTLVAPNSWRGASGLGEAKVEGELLAVRASDRTHFQALLFFEKLRVARGKVKRSVYPDELFKVAIRNDRAAERLATPVSLNYVLPTRFTEIINRIGKETKTQFFVDWQSLEEKGWNPNAEITFGSDKEPLSAALAKMLEPMELEYRVINAATIQITTSKAIAERPELEMHPIGDLLTDKLDSATLIAQIRRDLEGMELSVIDNSLQFDAKSNCVVAMVSQTHQNEIAKMLARRRADK